MKTRNMIAFCAFVGLSSFSQVGAAQKDEAVEVLTSYKQMLEGREGTDVAVLDRISGLIAEETTDPRALTEILRELHPEFSKALEAAANTEDDKGITQLMKLTKSANPYLAAESTYYLGRTLMSRQRMEEALPVFIKLQDDYFDNSLRIGEAIYYQGICEANTLQRDAASISLNDFVDLYPDAPERLLAEAQDLIGSIENVLDGSIEDVADHMDYSTSKLELVESGERTQEVQGDIIAMLDELIEQAENPPPSSGGSPSGSPSQGDKPGQQPGGGQGKQAGKNAQAQTAPKVVRRIRGAAASAWDDLRDRERGTDALSAMKSKYPARYKELVEQYYRSLQDAEKEGGQ